jgi:hypothetical protein
MTTRPAIIIPPALKLLAKRKRWALWKWEKGKKGKLTKVPYQGHAPRKRASSTDPSTWCDLNTTMLAYTEGKCDGIGFMLSGGGVSAIDIDDCRDAETNELHPWATNQITRSNSYAEVTPSNEGIRIVGLGKGKELHRKFSRVPDADGVGCELYRRADRFITVTGRQIGGATKLARIDALLDETLAELERAKQAPKPKKRKQHDLDDIIKNGEGGHFDGHRASAIWYVINEMLRRERPADEIAAVLLDRSNRISEKVYEQSDPKAYVRKQIEDALAKRAEDPDVEITRLAQLTPLQYEQERKAAAEKLDVRASILDRLVQAERVRLGLDGDDDGKQGRAISYPEVEPWPEPVNGAELLDEIAEVIGGEKRHVVMAEVSHRVIATLWVVHTYLLDKFWITPRLAVRSPTKRCGKSTLFYVLKRLVFRPQPTENATPAALFRLIEGYRPTIFADEADTYKNNEDLRNIFDSGYHRDGCVVRCIGDDHEPRVFSTYAALAIALIGKLPDTVHDRSVVIDLKRRKRSEKIKQLRLDRAGHLDVLARKIARWVKDHAEKIGDADPEMPPEIYSREADKWCPLLAIADEAGGKWPELARTAAIQSHQAEEGDDGSQLELLLGDIRGTFPEKGTKVRDLFGVDQVIISSADLVKALIAIEGRPWAEMGKSRKPLTQNRLARMLKAPGLSIAPKNVGPEDARVRGYILADFKDAFDRYLEPVPEEQSTQSASEEASQPPIRPAPDEIRTSDISKPHSPDPGCADEKCEKANNDGLLGGCAVVKGGAGAKTRMRTKARRDEIKGTSSDPLYTGPLVEVPDLGPDQLDEHGAPVVAQDQRTVASVPFMLTQELKRRLRVCGYSDEQIARMTPQEAHNILGQLAPQPTTNGSADGDLTQQRRAELVAWRRKWIDDGEKVEDVDDAVRAIIREEVDNPSQVEIEFARVMAAS